MDTKKVTPKAAQKKATRVLKGKVLRLISGGGRKERVKTPLDGAARDELHALANIVGAIAVATFEGYETDAGLAFVADRLRVLAGAGVTLRQSDQP